MSAGIKHIVLGVTGSIAAYKAADLIRLFQEQECDVTVVMTKEAGEFITPLTLASLSGKKVYGDMFEQDGWRMGHLELARADAVLIAPATANIIGKLACGIADDLMTTLCISTKAPVYLAPAMNEDMYNNAIVKENCEKLKKHGVRLIEPITGKLACGIVGVGHLAKIEDIVKVVLQK